MRIGLVTDFYYPWIGGPATFIRNLGHGLSARGHSVSLLCPSPDGNRTVETDGPIEISRARSAPTPFGYNLRVSSSPLVDVTRWIDCFQPDVVHTHHPFPLSAAAAWVARRRGIHTVATNHTIPECSLWGLRPHARSHRVVSAGFGRWIVAVLDVSERVTTPTSTAARLLHQLGYTRPIDAISNGVDTKRFFPGARPRSLARDLGIDDRPVVLYTGRLDAEKQMEVWLHAAALLSKEMDVQFLVGGQGSERPRLEALSRHLGLDRSVHFFGYLTEDEYPAVYRLADVFCITSEVELQSIATLEAIASGLPAVGVRAAALPELIRDGQNGFLADVGDPGGVADALFRILSDSEKAARMRQESRDTAERHDLRSTIARYETVLLQTTGMASPVLS